MMKSTVIALMLLGGCLQAQEPNALPLKSRIEFANVDGRIDRFNVDIKGRRLFMANCLLTVCLTPRGPAHCDVNCPTPCLRPALQ
jgi:hypothetical protein